MQRRSGPQCRGIERESGWLASSGKDTPTEKEIIMKRRYVVSLVLGVLFSLCGAFSAEAQLRQNEVTFWYYAHNSSWWTGLAIINNNLSTNQMRVEVYGSGDNFPDDTKDFSIGPNEHWIKTLDALFQIGSIPGQGYLRILGTKPFHVTEVIGERSPFGGVTMHEKSSEAIGE